MPSIGTTQNTITFLTMRGNPTGFKMHSVRVTRPNVDGNAYRHEGKRAEPYQLNTYAVFTTAANMKTAQDACEALQSQIVTIVDSFGITHENQIVLSVQPLNRHNPLRVISGDSSIVLPTGPAYELRMVWVLEAAAPITPPAEGG